MQKLLEMLEIVKNEGIIEVNTGGKKKHADRKAFYKFMETCQPFVIKPSGRTTDIDAVDNWEAPPDFDPPFPVFSIEILGGSITAPKPGVDEDLNKLWIYCVVVCEFAPKEFVYYAYAHIEHESGLRIGRVFMGPWFGQIIKPCIDRINSEVLGTEHVRKVIKFGTPKSKREREIRTIIHVRSKNTEPSEYVSQGRVVDWSHKWLVRGHWRKTSGLGKNREGQYAVPGFTWVKEHAKGPEDAPLVTKTRIVEK